MRALISSCRGPLHWRRSALNAAAAAAAAFAAWAAGAGARARAIAVLLSLNRDLRS